MPATHTPGPWVFTDGGNSDEQPADALIVRDSEDVALAIIRNDGDTGGAEVSFDEAEANARLIAAAPDLLAALEAVYECAKGDDAASVVPLDTLVTIRAAIAKATH